MVESLRDSMRNKRFGDLAFEVVRAFRAQNAQIRILLDAIRDNTTPAVRAAIRAQVEADPDFNEDWKTWGQEALQELIDRPEPLPAPAVPLGGGRTREATRESEAPNA